MTLYKGATHDHIPLFLTNKEEIDQTMPFGIYYYNELNLGSDWSRIVLDSIARMHRLCRNYEVPAGYKRGVLELDPDSEIHWIGAISDAKRDRLYDNGINPFKKEAKRVLDVHNQYQYEVTATVWGAKIHMPGWADGPTPAPPGQPNAFCTYKIHEFRLLRDIRIALSGILFAANGAEAYRMMKARYLDTGHISALSYPVDGKLSFAMMLPSVMRCEMDLTETTSAAKQRRYYEHDIWVKKPEDCLTFFE